MLQIRIDNDVRATLETAHLCRCLCTRKILIESRFPQPIKQWVDRLVDEACQAVLRDLQRDPNDFTKQVLMIQLNQNQVFFCFDLFLAGCSEEARAGASGNLDLPMHEILKAPGARTYSMRRNTFLLRPFVTQYASIRNSGIRNPGSSGSSSNVDGGDELPYFEDLTMSTSYYSQDEMCAEEMDMDLNDIIDYGGRRNLPYPAFAYEDSDFTSSSEPESSRNAAGDVNRNMRGRDIR